MYLLQTKRHARRVLPLRRLSGLVVCRFCAERGAFGSDGA
jgi:hypothetical protein